MTQTLYLGMPVLAFDKALILSLAHEPGVLVFAAGPVLTASVPLLVAGALADGACQLTVPARPAVMLRTLQRGCSSLERLTETEGDDWRPAAPPLRRPGPRGLATFYVAALWPPNRPRCRRAA
jgi:hypothetical protein